MAQTFINGSIFRLLLKDFMTYKKVELNCGPNLNLVLGPNGTGKSALVCGIIIGLGGEPTTTGRSGSIGEYIRFGCDSALVEIELFNEKPNEKNFLIQRNIVKKTRNEKVEFTSNYRLNGRDCNRTHIREFIKNLNINVDNLCQFLPQERVIEFVKMDEKTLLECTEKAAGDIDMFDSHKQMVSLTNDIKKLKDINVDLNNQISSETELQTRAAEELRRVEERDKFKEEIHWLNKKRPWIEYEEKRKEYVAAKEEMVLKREELQRVMKSLDPLKADVKKWREISVKSEGDKHRVFEDIKKSAKLIEPVKVKVEECYGKITDVKVGYFEKIDQENRRKSRSEQIKNELILLKDQLENISEDVNVEEEIKEVVKQHSFVNSEYDKEMAISFRIKEQHEKVTIERNKLESDRRRIGDIFNRRLEKLSQLNLNARKAYEWLSKNEKRFSGKIYPPILTQINMKNNDWAKYVESAISKNDLMSFMCEDKKDLQLFTKLVHSELNIRVNVVLAPDQDADDFTSDIDIRQLSRYGIHSYIKDMFTAPNKVMAYLCKTARIHQIPVGNDTTDSKFLSQLIESFQFRRIYTNKNLYNITVSRYDNEKVIRNDALVEAKYLNLGIDENELKRFEVQIAGKDKQISEIVAKKEANEEAKAQLGNQLSELRNKKKLLDNKKNEKRVIETKIGDKEEQLTRCENSSIDLNSAKVKAEQDLKALEDKQINLLKKLNESIVDCVKKSNNKFKVVLNETLAKKCLQLSDRKLSTASIQFQDLRNECKRIQESLEELKNAAKDMRKRAEEESQFDINKCTPEIRDKFDAMPDSVEEIDNNIATLTLRMESILDADDSVKNLYHRRRRDIERKRQELEEKRELLTETQTKLEDVKNRWLPSLEQLIAKINTNFGNSMARLNCAGEVSLFKGNDEEAYDEYGITIKVKFRQTEQLKALTSFHQSGGERSVSTMIYMIALQELTHVPFRCVDEINQGMDENNERSVFDLISETSSRNSSQYFLFSPKLLRDLIYTENMRIHVIFNGPFMKYDWIRLVDEVDDIEESD